MAVTSEQWVDAGPFRAHLHHLMAVGDLSAAEVATLAGVPPRMTCALLQGRNGRPVKRINAGYARALLAVTAYQARTVRSRQVPAAESSVRLRWLLTGGAHLEDLADELEIAPGILVQLAEGSVSWCNGLLALRLLLTVRSWPGRAPDSEVAA